MKSHNLKQMQPNMIPLDQKFHGDYSSVKIKSHKSMALKLLLKRCDICGGKIDWEKCLSLL